MLFNKSCTICGNPYLCTTCEEDLNDPYVTYVNPDKIYVGSGDSCIPSLLKESNFLPDERDVKGLLPFVLSKEKQSPSGSTPILAPTKYSEI